MGPRTSNLDPTTTARLLTARAHSPDKEPTEEPGSHSKKAEYCLRVLREVVSKRRPVGVHACCNHGRRGSARKSSMPWSKIRKQQQSRRSESMAQKTPGSRVRMWNTEVTESRPSVVSSRRSFSCSPAFRRMSYLSSLSSCPDCPDSHRQPQPCLFARSACLPFPPPVELSSQQFRTKIRLQTHTSSQDRSTTSR